MAVYEDFIRDVARSVLDKTLPDGEFDFVSEISRELPIRFLCSIFTVPQEDAPELIRWGDKMIANQDPELSDAVPDQVDTEAYRLLPFRSPAAYEVWAYADRQKELRRQGPTDDVISALTVAQDEGRLNDHDFHNYFSLLMIAGNETTRHTITSGMLALMQDPEQMQLLKDDPSLISNATEEILRWATPVLHFRRTATRDVELRGQQIKAGDKVVTWYISANRDEEKFADPYRFDVTRKPNDHVTFGPGGPHFCLGAHLARLETKILFQELLPRLDSIELAGPVERIRSNFVNGIKRMPVRVTLASLVHSRTSRRSVPRRGTSSATAWPGRPAASASRCDVTSTSSALNSGNSCSILRVPAAVSETSTMRPSRASFLRRTNLRPSSVVMTPVAVGRLMPDGGGEVARLHLAPDPQHPEPGERRPGQPVGGEDVRLHMPADRGRRAEQVRHGPHRPEVERSLAERIEDLAFGGEQLVLHARASPRRSAPPARARPRRSRARRPRSCGS